MKKSRRRKESSLDWAIRQLEEAARAEKNPAIKALWLRAAAHGCAEKAALDEMEKLP